MYVTVWNEDNYGCNVNFYVDIVVSETKISNWKRYCQSEHLIFNPKCPKRNKSIQLCNLNIEV